jgi:DNA helicase-2/ATP-dependent DNA helicase PcrA
VEIAESQTSYGGYGGSNAGGRYGSSRFDNVDTFDSTYSSPGWQRAQGKQASGGNSTSGNRWGAKPSGFSSGFGGGKTIEGNLVASSINEPSSNFKVGDRVFHLKFGNGNVALVDGNKLTIDFDKAGQKRVLDSFVEGR